ncbi:MAG TPA: hypothetical protein VN948_03215 [Terriglobales bacterium]|nr:hypothetical protein [Terriglobales bacterium]
MTSTFAVNRKLMEKLDYMHRNPVQRGLVTRPEDWTWSSARRYAPNKLSSRAEHQVRAANLMRSRGTLCGVYPVVRRRDVS